MALAFHFSKPLFLWLAVLIPIYIASHFYFLKRNQDKAMRFANFEALKRISGERLVTKNLVIFFTRLVVLIAMIVVLSGATLYYDGLRSDFDYVLVIDTSASMSSDDISPTRLGAAKEAALTFLSTKKTDAKIGLVSYAGVTFVHSALTDEEALLRLKIADLDISRMSGSDLSSAIITSANLFTDEDRGKAIILFTDGGDTAGAFIENNILEAIRYVQAEQITIFPIGLGTQDGAIGYLPVDYNLTSSVNVEGLEYMANQTGGVAVFPQTINEAVTYFEDFNARSQQGRVAVPLYRYALLLAFVLLIAEWALFNLFFRRVA